MMLQIKRWLAPPLFPDDEPKTHRAILLNFALLTCMVLALCLIAGNLVGGTSSALVTGLDIGSVVMCLVLRRLAYQGRVGLASGALLAVGLVGISMAVVILGTIRTPTTAMYMLLVIFAGLLFDLGGLIAMTVLCSLAIAGLIVAENTGLLPRPDYTVTISQWVAYTVLFAWVGSLTLSSLQSTRRALARAVKEISEHKQAEKTLRESEERFRAIASNTPDHILMQDRQLIYKFVVNPQLGLTEQDMIGKTDYDFLSKEEADRLTQVKTRLLESGQPVHLETSLISKVGETEYFDGACIPKFDDQGQVDGLFGYFRNVTERKRAEEALRISEEKYRLLVENANEAILVTQDGMIKFVNRIAGDLTGYSEKELASLPFLNFIHPDDRDLVVERHPCRRKGDNLRSKAAVRLNSRDGSTKWVEISTVLIDWKGKPATLNFLSDITERKQAEKLQNAIYRIAQSVNQVASLDALYSAIHTIIREIMVADNFYITLYDEKNDLLCFPYFVDDRDPQFPPRKLGKGLTEYVFRMGKSVLCDEALYESLIQRGEIELVGVHSPIWLGVPLIVESKVIGVMVVQDFKNARAYGGREQGILEFVSSQAAMAIHRKQVEEALRESEERYRLLVETLPDGVIVHSQGRIVFANPASARIGGAASPTELIGKPVMEFVHPDYRELVLKRIQQSFREGILAPAMEEMLIRLDGTPIDVRITAIPFSYAGKSAMLTVFNDITERKRGAEALRESEKNLKEAQLFGQIGNWDYDIEGQKITWSDEVYRLYERDPVLGPPTAEEEAAYYSTEQAQMLHEYARRAVEEEQEFEYDLEARLPSGKRVYFSVKMRPVKDARGRIARLFGTVQDITERVRTEKELVQSHEQLHALTAYWQAAVETERAYIAREIHDEFGQSMTALKMDLTWLVNRLPEGDERVERIRGMNMLVDDSIALMRRIATELRPGLLDDLGLSAALEWQAREFSRHSGIPCKLNLPEQDLGLDPAMNTTLFRIFQETLTNIARHAQATRINASLKQTERTLVLTMRDNGRGITEGELNNPRSLGLLGLRERAAQWGGKTTIRGAAGKGTTVTVRIPLPASPMTGGDR